MCGKQIRLLVKRNITTFLRVSKNAEMLLYHIEPALCECVC